MQINPEPVSNNNNGPSRIISPDTQTIELIEDAYSLWVYLILEANKS